jgi:riboflavin kinase/FMN adenylyltransferase
MMNIGIRPTVNGSSRTIEVNIFDFESDIYNQQITLEFISHIREEQKFDGLDALKNQLKTDKDVAQKLLI